MLLTRQFSQEPNEWECLVRPGRKIGVGERLFFGNQASGNDTALQADVISRGTFGERRIRFLHVPDFFAAIERIGHVPLPPYIDREDQPADRERYQTIYAREKGSVAAPTAGLHFTPEILDRIKARGIETAEVTLHVGLGTFQPVREERVEDHKLHREPYSISAEAASPSAAPWTQDGESSPWAQPPSEPSNIQPHNRQPEGRKAEMARPTFLFIRGTSSVW